MKLQFKVNQPIDVVFDYLTDMQKFVSVHPVITSIDETSANNYLVHETLKFGFIPFSFTYKAEIEKDFIDKKILMKATVMKLIKIEMNYTLFVNADCTTISETIIFKSSLPVRSIMEKIFRKQHTQLFKNIETVE